jgi:pimeloyl-ACP methyl ester carboxylesterase
VPGPTPGPDPSSVRRPGPWTHRDISANGTRLHVAELGDGPLILLLHGFPEFWWSWRHQILPLAEAGYRVAAVDLRGYGASDKPPRGYDPFTLSADLAGLISALGAQDATLVGSDWGAFLAWTTAALHPKAVRDLAVLSMPHPLSWRAGMVRRPGAQVTAASSALWFQLPWRPERLLVADDSVYTGELLRRWSGPAGNFPDAQYERACRDAIRIPGVAHSALEYFRWLVRSSFRPDGARLTRILQPPTQQAVLQIHGEADPYTLLATAATSRERVAGSYDWVQLPGVGHFPHQEAPDDVTDALLSWLGPA